MEKRFESFSISIFMVIHSRGRIFQAVIFSFLHNHETPTLNAIVALEKLHSSSIPAWLKLAEQFESIFIRDEKNEENEKKIINFNFR